MDSVYQPLNDDDEQLFQRHSEGIDKAVRQTFSSIPSDFQLKAVTIRKIRGCGMFYDFKIPLPDGKYAKVSFHTGGYPIQRPAGEKKPEPNFKVDPEPSSSAQE